MSRMRHGCVSCIGEEILRFGEGEHLIIREYNNTSNELAL
jgi:hypothetical protein